METTPQCVVFLFAVRMPGWERTLIESEPRLGANPDWERTPLRANPDGERMPTESESLPDNVLSLFMYIACH